MTEGKPRKSGSKTRHSLEENCWCIMSVGGVCCVSAKEKRDRVLCCAVSKKCAGSTRCRAGKTSCPFSCSSCFIYPPSAEGSGIDHPRQEIGTQAPRCGARGIPFRAQERAGSF